MGMATESSPRESIRQVIAGRAGALCWTASVPLGRAEMRVELWVGTVGKRVVRESLAEEVRVGVVGVAAGVMEVGVVGMVGIVVAAVATEVAGPKAAAGA